MKKTLLLLSLLLISGCLSKTNGEPYATMNNETIKLEIAETNYERNIGLSSHYTLSLDWGMIFLFENYGEQRFYMKGMRFPIDIIWIDENFTVTRVLNNAQPCTNGCETYSGFAKYVLEVNSGIAGMLNITKGSKIGLFNV